MLAIHAPRLSCHARLFLRAQVAQNNPKTMLVNELFIGDHVKIKQTCRELGLHRRGGYQQHKCYMTFVEQARPSSHLLTPSHLLTLLTAAT